MDTKAETERPDWRMLIEQADEHAFILIDPDGVIVDFSPGATRIFNRPRDAAIGKAFDTIFTPEDRERGISDLELHIAARDAISEDDRWQVRADGSRFWATGVTTALRDANGRLVGYAKVLRDRTDLRERLSTLKQRASVAKAIAAQREIAIATLAHELRNVLASMSNGLSMLLAPGADAARKEGVGRLMEEQISLMQRLTDDLLEAEQLKRGKASLQLEIVKLQELLEHVIAPLRPRVAAKRLTIELLAPATPIRVKADRTRLHQVFTNLIENAIKYTPVEGRIWVKATIEEPQGVVHVEDDGIGIPHDMLSRIFELFTQVATDAPRRGLGVGLALVRDIIELHGGSVQARSEGPGRGSQFTVRLMLASNEEVAGG